MKGQIINNLFYLTFSTNNNLDVYVFMVLLEINYTWSGIPIFILLD
jgi:hypothetical protein